LKKILKRFFDDLIEEEYVELKYLKKIIKIEAM
jgi:hypothetical protein